MKSLYALIFSGVLLPISALAADLHVKKGETYTLKEGVKLLDLDNLVLEDNTVLSLQNVSSEVMIRAKHASVGKNVTILGEGADGADGASADSTAAKKAQDCTSPIAGTDGAPGKNGVDAVSVNLDWGITSFGDLTVLLTGGNSGAGGRGGNGQDADQNKGCSIESGGAAGAGGASGDSGNGGNFNFVYRGLGNDARAFQAKEHTLIKNDAGNVSKSGVPGKSGKGSPGRYVSKRSLTGSRSWVGGGDAGGIPRETAEGRRGRDGLVTFHLGAASINYNPEKQQTRSSKTPAPAYEERIRSLEMKVESLLKRIESLESSK